MAGAFIEKSRHGTVFYFRRRVPLDLVESIGKRHIYVTLQTHERRTALVRARELAVQTDCLFEEMRKPKIEPRTKFVDSQGRITDIHAFHRASRGHASEGPRSYTKRLALKLNEKTGRPAEVVFDDVKPGEEGAVETLARKFVTLDEMTIAPARSTATPTVREAIDDLVKSGEISARSLKEYRRILNGFADHVGAETFLGAISQERFAEYAALIQSRDGWAEKTKNNTITIAARLFNRYEGRNSAVPKISSKGLKTRRSRPAGQDRDAFTLDELRELFTSALKYRENEPCKWWITVAPVFLGCRIEELAQAHVAGDFYRDPATGAMVLKITEDSTDDSAPSKSVKTLAGWRRVPLHPVLEEAGFVNFIQEQRVAGFATPFASQWSPSFDKETGGTIHGHAAVKWGGNEMKRLRNAGRIQPKSKRKLTYFHSMRHTFVTLLAAADIAEEWRAALAGQECGGVNSQVYSKAREDISATLPLIEKGLRPVAELLRNLLDKAS